MGRIILEFVLPALLPTLLYVAWLAAERRRIERAGTGQVRSWADAPWLWLAALGVLLAGVLTAGLSLSGGGDIHGVYVPPRTLEDGSVVPGHVDTH